MAAGKRRACWQMELCGRQGAHRMRHRRSSLCSVSSRMTSAMRSALVTAAGLFRCIKRERSYLFSALIRGPTTGPNRIHEETMRPFGRTITYMPLDFEVRGGISDERLVSVDANSRRSGFLPAAPKFCGFGPSLPPQNATNYTTLPANKKPPPKIGRGHPSIH
jgi:hypothetical protein